MMHSGETILIVEDSDEDFFTTTRTFKKLNISNPVDRCVDGQQALDYIHQDHSKKPMLILLDLNLPKINGKQVLKQLKNHVDYKAIPVIVFTTSNSADDIEECYQLGANSFVNKPVGLEQLVESMKCLKEYWFKLVLLPKE